MTDSDIDTVFCILLAEDLRAQLRTATTLPAPANDESAPPLTTWVWS